MSTQVKTLVFFGCHAENPLQLKVMAKPVLEPGQMWVKILLATICGSDHHTINGKRKEPTPSVLGHEAVGLVVECRRNSSDCNPGDRITFNIVNSCHKCHMCDIGYQQKCISPDKFKYGHTLSSSKPFSGCYATHILIEENTEVFVIPQSPEVLPDAVIAPINCALATVVNAVKNIPKLLNKKPNSVLIQGAGMLGIYAAIVLRHEYNFSKVLCCDPNLKRLQQSQQFGVEMVQDMSEVADDSVDVVIEACGSPTVINDGMRCLRTSGLYLLLGLVHPNSVLNILAETIIRKCLTLKGVHNYTAKDLKLAVDIVARMYPKYPLDKLISPEYSLDDYSNAFECMQTQQYLRVAIRPS